VLAGFLQNGAAPLRVARNALTLDQHQPADGAEQHDIEQQMNRSSLSRGGAAAAKT
jgi:hypothetical protein